MTRPNEQHQFDLLYMPHNLFEGNIYKYVLTGIDVASRYKVARPLRTKKSSEVTFVLEAIYKKGGVFKYLKVFQCDMVQSLKMQWQSCLINTMLIFKGQQQNISTSTRSLWKLLTKSWQNCCKNRWMLKSFRTRKKVLRFGLKIWTRLWTKWTIQYRRWLIWRLRMHLN